MARLFTLEEATALLPRLREVLPEMQAKKAALDTVRHELALMTRTAAGNGHLQGGEAEHKRKEGQELAERLNALLAEVQGMGCELKGLDEGLIDFPAERDGHSIYLCWKLGEDTIAHWHDQDSGFAGRQPL